MMSEAIPEPKYMPKFHLLRCPSHGMFHIWLSSKKIKADSILDNNGVKV